VTIIVSKIKMTKKYKEIMKSTDNQMIQIYVSQLYMQELYPIREEKYK